MLARFELFVARRYLRARRKEAVISVITVISIAGVAAGVMALVIALAVTNGFRSQLQRSLLGVTAHVSVAEKESGSGIENWRELIERLRKMPHVVGAAPVLYVPIFLSGPLMSKGALLKGVDFDSELQVSETLRRLKEGSLERLRRPGRPPGIVLGSALAQEMGMLLNSNVTVVVPQTRMTPFGMRTYVGLFRVVGIFESGFYQSDSALAFTTLGALQEAMSLPDVINYIELKLDDLYRAPEVAKTVEKTAGHRFAATTWMEQSRQLMSALRMEKAVTVITIGLIELVAALNILITLVMMVMEKYRDIGILVAMGARREQIRKIFMLQGVLIGVLGTAVGLAIGHTLCYFAERQRWIRLDEQVYALSFVPFEPRLGDSIWIAAAAILVSFLATIYPARNATRITPVEVLRYE